MDNCRAFVWLPGESKVALRKLPDAKLYWFERCGHFAQCDKPAETVRLILKTTRGDGVSDASKAKAA